MSDQALDVFLDLDLAKHQFRYYKQLVQILMYGHGKCKLLVVTDPN